MIIVIQVLDVCICVKNATNEIATNRTLGVSFKPHSLIVTRGIQVSEWKAGVMEEATDLLIIGAGPYGLAMAAYARHLGIDHVVVGKPMDFWKVNMPAGMYLRTRSDVHIDPLGIHTIEKFLEIQGLSPTDVEPLSLQFYLSYAQWFQEQKQIDTVPVLVQRLDCADGEEYDALPAIVPSFANCRASKGVVALPSIFQ